MSFCRNDRIDAIRVISAVFSLDRMDFESVEGVLSWDRGGPRARSQTKAQAYEDGSSEAN
jgi:hypothetical protein